MSGRPILEVENLRRVYRSGGHQLAAVDGVSFAIEPGSIFGIVGESGSGKSTLARLVMALDRPTAGTVRFDGHDICHLPGRQLRRLRLGFQMVFQDPYGSLDPRQRVERIVSEPLHLDPRAPRGLARRRLVEEVLVSVGMEPSDAGRYPHEFSGGQRQRIAIARAIIGRPKLVIADEPVSALDLSVQAQVLNLIMDLRDRHGIAFLFISHNLSVVEVLADRIAVMVSGRFVETGTAADVFQRPTDPYTRRLLAAEPRIDGPRRRGAATPPAGVGRPTPTI